MPFEPRVEPDAPVLPVPVDPAGLRGPTKTQAARSRWRRVGPRAYVPAGVEQTVAQRIAEATAFMGVGAAVTGWAALHLAGAAYFDGVAQGSDRPVPLALGRVPGRRTPPGVALTYEPPGAALDLLGVRCVLPTRALFDEIRVLGDRRDGVVAFDMAAAAGVTSLRRLTAFHVAHTGWRRASRVARILPHVSEHSASPPESRLRLLWTSDAALPTPLVNRRLCTLDGRFICTPDLFDPEAGLVVEYDGAEHRKITRHTSDAARYERAREAGLEYCIVTSLDMRRPTEVVTRLHAARRRALFLPPERRLWRIEPRQGWTLDERLDAREQMAQGMWLQHGVHIPPW